MIPYYDHAGITLYHGDCREILPHLPKVDLVLTDPPYADQTHDGALTNRWNGIQKLVDFDSISFEDLRSVFSLIGPLVDGWVVSFMDYAHIVKLESNPPDNLRFVRFGIWVKINPIPQLSGDRPAQGFEGLAIYHSIGGRMSWNGGGRPAVWRFAISSEHKHPTQKPIKLVSALVSDFSNVEDLILGAGPPRRYVIALLGPITRLAKRLRFHAQVPAGQVQRTPDLRLGHATRLQHWDMANSLPKVLAGSGDSGGPDPAERLSADRPTAPRGERGAEMEHALSTMSAAKQLSRK